MKREYSVSYTTNGEKVQDILKTLDLMVALCISRVNKKFIINSITSLDEFYE